MLSEYHSPYRPQGVNDGLELAHQLGALLAGRNVVLNLIPWNPIYSPDGPPFAAPALERVQVCCRSSSRAAVHCDSLLYGLFSAFTCSTSGRTFGCVNFTE